jgi:hypothetical protein
MSDPGLPRSDVAGQPGSLRAALRTPEQAVERIDKPSARPQLRARVAFNKQAWWAVLLVAVGVIYLATALGFQRVHNENTVIVFGQVTEQAPMAWYYDHPWFGALVLAGLPALAFAWLIVTLMETRHRAAELQTDVADLMLQLQHTGYRLQGQLDQIAANLERPDPAP